jgi:acetolactate synthase-1/2/3 large subunit
MEGRPGAVHVGLPVGMSAETAGVEAISFTPPQEPAPADAAKLREAAAMFASAKKPVLAVGLGAVHAQVQAEIKALAEKHNIPVVLTPMAKGMLAEDHPSYTGVLFHALSNIVGETHQQADLVIGIDYDPVEFNYEAWMPKTAPLISLDIAPADIDLDSYTLAVDAVGNIKASLKTLLEVPPIASGWDMKAMHQRRAAMNAKLKPSNEGFGPKGALAVLREVLSQDGIMACDVGAHTHLIGQVWPTPAPGLQIMTNGWSTMGYGIPAAIAAKLVHPEKQVCAVVGDGGFLMTCGELVTALRRNLKIVILLLTDNDLALIRIKQEKKSNPIYGTTVRSKGRLGGDQVFGVPVKTEHDATELRAALEAAFAADGPVIVEAIVNSREYDEVVLKKDKP